MVVNEMTCIPIRLNVWLLPKWTENENKAQHLSESRDFWEYDVPKTFRWKRNSSFHFQIIDHVNVVRTLPLDVYPSEWTSERAIDASDWSCCTIVNEFYSHMNWINEPKNYCYLLHAA